MNELHRVSCEVISSREMDTTNIDCRCYCVFSNNNNTNNSNNNTVIIIIYSEIYQSFIVPCIRRLFEI